MTIVDRVRWVFKKTENKSLNVHLRREGEREEEERKKHKLMMMLFIF